MPCATRADTSRSEFEANWEVSKRSPTTSFTVASDLPTRTLLASCDIAWPSGLTSKIFREITRK